MYRSILLTLSLTMIYVGLTVMTFGPAMEASAKRKVAKVERLAQVDQLFAKVEVQ